MASDRIGKWTNEDIATALHQIAAEITSTLQGGEPLRSFAVGIAVGAIERAARELLRSTAPVMEEIPALYDVARDTCHAVGVPWTDPRTGILYPPPKKTTH